MARQVFLNTISMIPTLPNDKTFLYTLYTPNPYPVHNSIPTLTPPSYTNPYTIHNSIPTLTLPSYTNPYPIHNSIPTLTLLRSTWAIPFQCFIFLKSRASIARSTACCIPLARYINTALRKVPAVILRHVHLSTTCCIPLARYINTALRKVPAVILRHVHLSTTCCIPLAR